MKEKKKLYGEKASRWERAGEIQALPGFMNSVREMIALDRMKTEYIGIGRRYIAKYKYCYTVSYIVIAVWIFLCNSSRKRMCLSPVVQRASHTCPPCGSCPGRRRTVGCSASYLCPPG